MSRIIESRSGAEVYASDAGFVCIKQNDGVLGEQIVVLHPDDIELLIDHLKETVPEAYEIRKNPPVEPAA